MTQCQVGSDTVSGGLCHSVRWEVSQCSVRWPEEVVWGQKKLSGYRPQGTSGGQGQTCREIESDGRAEDRATLRSEAMGLPWSLNMYL